ncbi:hypothetical protein OAI00_03735 [Euryarchaeota archaeon]|nr:hypothetical protein [Euryarchaeota archaeon]
MEELATIWSDIDRLTKKPNVKKVLINKNNLNLCKECNNIKVFNGEGLPTCSVCGLIDNTFIDESPEWTSGISEDGKVSDPSRCGNPNSNPELFSDSWGKGTIITSNRNSSYQNKRIAKINFHQSMNHRDRSLYHAYKFIEEACHTLPDCVLKDAKIMYRKFNTEKLTRGAVRSGIKANCVLYACRMSKIPRTTKEIADMFSIKSRDLSRTTEMFKSVMLGSNNVGNKLNVTKPFNVMNRLLNSFEITKDERFSCLKMCSDLEKCPNLMSKTPTSVASVVIYMVMCSKISKSVICKKCNVSVPTVNKIEQIIKEYLEDRI